MVGGSLYWLTVIPLFLVVIVFAVTNHDMTELSLWPVLMEPVAFPIYGVAFIGLFIGFLIGGFVSWISERAVAPTRSRVAAAIGIRPERNCCFAEIGWRVRKRGKGRLPFPPRSLPPRPLNSRSGNERRQQSCRAL